MSYGVVFAVIQRRRYGNLLVLIVFIKGFTIITRVK